DGRELGGKPPPLRQSARAANIYRRGPKDAQLALFSLFRCGRNRGITMRAVPYFLSALLLCAMLGSANAAPATIEGSWSGSGIGKFRNRADRVVCRVSFPGIEGKPSLVSALCSAGGRRYE